jgi:hypothetical protein
MKKMLRKLVRMIASERGKQMVIRMFMLNGMKILIVLTRR